MQRLLIKHKLRFLVFDSLVEKYVLLKSSGTDNSISSSSSNSSCFELLPYSQGFTTPGSSTCSFFLNNK